MDTGLKHRQAERQAFARIACWIFDLDNTLYPHESKIWPQVDQRITLFIGQLLGVDGLTARVLQKHYYHRYGSSLQGLMVEYGVDPRVYQSFVHDIDHSLLQEDPDLAAAIARLPGKRYILTNGSQAHAEAIAGKLGILSLFDGIADVADTNFVPKPAPDVYHAFMKRFAVDPSRATMFEDSAVNLRVPSDLGITTILVVPKTHDPFREAFEQAAEQDAHIDYITDDLAGFLRNAIDT